MAPVPVEFFFDIMCPYAYQTAGWIREVRDQGLVEVTWSFASLEEFNLEPGKRHPWERPWSFGFGMLRVAALLRRADDGADRVDRYAAAAGRWLHEEGRKPHSPEASAEILTEIGLDPGLVAEAIDDPTTIDEVRADHDRAVAHGVFGVPALLLPSGRAWFGPVVAPAPTGDDAAALWALVAAADRIPNLYELKLAKTDRDIHHIAEMFRPYLEGRDWRTVERPAP